MEKSEITTIQAEERVRMVWILSKGLTDSSSCMSITTATGATSRSTCSKPSPPSWSVTFTYFNKSRRMMSANCGLLSTTITIKSLIGTSGISSTSPSSTTSFYTIGIILFPSSVYVAQSIHHFCFIIVIVYFYTNVFFFALFHNLLNLR